MQIFLLRHGNAGPTPPGGSDWDRALTPDGRDQVRRVIERAASEIGSPLIVSSPYLRAVESAAIAAGILGVESRSRSTELTPDSRPEDAWDDLRPMAGAGRPLLLVGHEPLFSALTAYLLGFRDLEVDYGTATLVAIGLESSDRRPGGRLRWMLTPNLCR